MLGFILAMELPPSQMSGAIGLPVALSAPILLKLEALAAFDHPALRNFYIISGTGYTTPKSSQLGPVV
jgi:hypothetical protein